MNMWDEGAKAWRLADEKVSGASGLLVGTFFGDGSFWERWCFSELVISLLEGWLF
jgi:hypothetical protein